MAHTDRAKTLTEN